MGEGWGGRVGEAAYAFTTLTRTPTLSLVLENIS